MSDKEDTKPASTEEETPKEEEHVEEENTTAKFEPVIQLEEVDVKSGEEDEDCVYSKRSKLYVFGETMLDKGTGNKTWMERGVGEVRLLKHKELGYIRLLMRQEKTMKLIVNHQLHPDLQLVPNAGSDRSWVWRADDFSNGETTEETSFAIRFGDSEIAKEFKEAFEKYQKEMRAIMDGADKPGEDGGKAGDEAAEALEKLSTKEKEEEGGEKEEST